MDLANLSSTSGILGYHMRQNTLLNLPTQMRFPIEGEPVTCRGLKLTDSLGRTKLTNSRVIRSCSLKPRQISEPVDIKQTDFFSIFELGGITKHLMTCPAGNSEFCFPLDLTLRVSGKKTHRFP